MSRVRDALRDPVVLAVLGIVAVALVLRLWDLGVRAMHHDESLHAYFSWRFAEGDGYRHDPLMHGPFQFHVMAALFKLFGSGEFIARLPAALAGTALVATPLLLRRWLGATGTIAAAAFFALSPTLLYYSRFARNDAFIALFSVLLIASIWRYRDDGRLRWLLVIAAALALSFATKEVAYLLAAVALVYLDVVLWRAYVAQRRASGAAWGGAVAEWALLPLAWAVAALWPLLRNLRGRLGLTERTREGDLVIVIGTLTATQLAAGVQIPLERLGVAVEGDTEFRVGLASLLALTAGAAAVGLLWRPGWWALCFGLFVLITAPLFSTFFTNPDGLGTGYWGSLDYWLAQQDVRRGEQPWFYYLMMLPIYELWLLVPGVVGGAWLLARRDHPSNRLVALLAWWFVGTYVALSMAGEKMPWLLVHLATPLALLAAVVAGVALPAAVRELRRPQASSLAWGAAGGGGAAVALLAALAVWSGTQVSFAHPDTPVEPLIYTQTAPDVPALTPRIARALEGDAAATATSAAPGAPVVVIDTTASLTWPWAWYLRGLPVNYAAPETIRTGNYDDGEILIVSQGTLAPSHPLRSRYESEPYHHRWWFPEAGYRAATWGGLVDRLADGSLLADWFEFLTSRIDERNIGSLDGEVLFPAGGAGTAAEPE